MELLIDIIDGCSIPSKCYLVDYQKINVLYNSMAISVIALSLDVVGGQRQNTMSSVLGTSTNRQLISKTKPKLHFHLPMGKRLNTTLTYKYFATKGSK